MKRQAWCVFLVCLVGIMFTGGISSAADEGEKDWNFNVELYGMMANIEGDSGLGYIEELPIDVDFGTILENLQASLMVHFEMRHRSGWGFWLDYGFMDLEQDSTGPAEVVVTDLEVKQGVLEAMALYRRPAGRGSLDYFGGIRWWNNEFSLSVSAPGYETRRKDRSEGWVDPVLGLRWIQPLGRNWDFQLSGDLAGFGISSDLSGSAYVGVVWTLGSLVQLDFRYKALWVDYETGQEGSRGYFKYDTVTHGPIIGLNFRF